MNLTLLAMAFASICINFALGEDDDHLKFEGDIMLPKYEMDHLDALLNGTLYDDLNRNAIRNPHQLWPGGVVPYTFSITGWKGARTRKAIKEALAEYSNKTCIRFKPRTNERDYIDFINGGGCWSYVGRLEDRQKLSIGNRCADLGTVLHELMHALGFWHEQSRADRDEYIQINFENIGPMGVGQFFKNDLNKMTHLGAEYDYCSVMHYSATAWSKNGNPTIVPKKPTGDCEIGKWNHLSDTDIREINTLYKCEGYPQIETTTTTTTTTTTKPKPTGRCVDNSRSCAGWAQRGECQKNPDWMLKNCRRSCNQCSAISRKCVDKNTQCQQWASVGECSKNPGYMHKKCAKSCNICTCITTNGNACVLPFTYGGNDYNGCTNVGHTRAWCATKEQQTGKWWGYCPSECKMHSEDSADAVVKRCFSTEGCPLLQDNLLTTLTELEKEFYISFEFRATQYASGWHSVFHLTTGGNGDRKVALWVTKDGQNEGKLYAWFTAVSVTPNEKYPIGQWQRVEFSQSLENSQYIFRLKINGDTAREMANSEATTFSNVKLYAGDPWHTPLDGSIRNIRIGMGETKGTN